jgi:hypothetical protein
LENGRIGSITKLSGFRDEVHPYAAQTSDHHFGLLNPFVLRRNANPLNQMKVAAALNHWSSPSAPHLAKTHLCISLSLSISFITKITRKRPVLNPDKTNNLAIPIIPILKYLLRELCNHI